jgi:hypothetical protein
VWSCQHPNRSGSRVPCRCYVERGIADYDDFRGRHPHGNRECEDRSRRRFGTEARIVSRDECQKVVEAQLANMSTRGSLGIIGDQAKLIAAAGEVAHDSLGIADGREVGCRRFAQTSVDLPKKAGSAGRPNNLAQRAAKTLVGSSISGELGRKCAPSTRPLSAESLR